MYETDPLEIEMHHLCMKPTLQTIMCNISCIEPTLYYMKCTNLCMKPTLSYEMHTIYTGAIYLKAVP